ncbi:Multidomain esterase [Colletotrichum aenigma]|uniref:Multidomain esterase n=1 Tax=Colletotrichum aenigma TaxID=1215731 RepID=UPI001872F48D|nr:Multidomain esterase [Colletotrichum aenigma]KAF5507162.1 Multidomain esterase [Colletotrichum aenigma]
MRFLNSLVSLSWLGSQALLFADTVTAHPTSTDVTFIDDPIVNETTAWAQMDDDVGYHGPKRRDDKTPLRIMALGASIVFGVGSPDQNSYRKVLRQQLRHDGHPVDMVGTKNSGNMKDNDVEAVSGFIVSEIHDLSKASYKFKPNMVIINAGTNDIVRSIDNANQHIRFRNMIQGLWDNISPGTVVIATTILPIGGEADARRQAVNEKYREVVRELYAQGRPIFLAEMDGHITLSDLDDGVHPNAQGFKKMAGPIYAAIGRARSQGRLMEPLDAGDALDQGGVGCHKVPGNGINAGALTQVGSGYDDGEYIHDAQDMGAVTTITSDWDRDQWFFARIFRSDRDDLLGWIKNGDKVLYAVRRNDGDGKFTLIGDLDVHDNCIQRGVQWADLNGDGLDDFVCIGSDGAVFASINNGNGGGGTLPTFTHIGTWKARDPAYAQADIRIADIDGDGRADFIGLRGNGDAWVWRNGGTGNKPSYFQAMGRRFEGKGMGNLAGTRFEDLNGDGRADWLWVSDNGQTTTYTNSRSCHWGKEGDGLYSAWRIGTNKASGKSPTHTGGMANGIRNRIHFASVYGSPQDFGLLSRKDYVWMEHKELSNGKHEFKVRVWKSKGYGATKPKADGNFYCDMTGNGRDDYIWVLSKGEMDLFENAGKDFIANGESYWKQPGQKAFFKPPRDLDRRDIHLTDFDGDGRCDIIHVDHNNGNRVEMWKNNYTPGGGFNWQYIANPAPALNCPEKRGVGFRDWPIRFADVTGSGRADYVCVEKDGRMWGWTQDGNGGWTHVDQFFSAKGHDRANLQFADVDGDGKSDIIWIEKFTGDSFVYYNLGRRDIGGSRYHWATIPAGGPEKAYTGSFAGSCQYFPDFDGDGRADLHSIQATFPNTAVTAYNRCGGNRNGDDWDPSYEPEIVMPPPGQPIEGTPGGGGAQPIEDGWREIPCTHQGVTDAREDAEWRWDQVLTPAAWAAALRNYKSDSESNPDFVFTRSISNFFNGPESMDCHKLTGANGCTGGSSLQCNDTNAPAGYFILNSFRNINAILWNTYEALGDSYNDAGTSIAEFGKTFSPVKDSDLSVAILIDILTLGYGAVMAPTWNKAINKVPWAKNNGDDFSTLKDFTNDMVLGGFTLTKDLIGNVVTSPDSALTVNLKLVINAWETAIDKFAIEIFSGKGDRLSKMIANGKMISSVTVIPSTKELRAEIDKALYATLIPLGWKISNRDLNPFIVDSKRSCDAANNDEWIKLRITNGAIKSEKVCIDDRAYFLLAAENPKQECDDDKYGIGCSKFDGLPGTSALGPLWGGVTREDMVRGSINTFKAHGNKNQENPRVPGILDAEQIDAMAEVNIQAPYVFNFPICDVNTSFRGYYEGGLAGHVKKSYFPCNLNYDL